jgi:hypothetical protein
MKQAAIILSIVFFSLISIHAQNSNEQVASAKDKKEDAPAKKGKAVVIPPEKAKPISIAKVEKAPTIDGRLDDEIWKQAVVFKDFVQIQPGDNIEPTKPTEILMAYDTKTLYVAFIAYDDKDKIRVTVPKRDQIFDDDYIGFFLDTFNDQRKAFVAFFNPLGIQADATYTESQGEDYSVDVVMESKGIVDDKGYTVEVAIPFKSIRYEAGKGKQWGAHFFRRIKRMNNELDSWMPISRDVSGTLVQAGKLTGFEGIATERTIEVIPTLTVSEEGQRVGVFDANNNMVGGRFINKPVKGDLGVSVKYNITPTVTLDFAYNPDFADVEADAPVVLANQRFPIFFQEKRPFFLEGVDIFQTEMSNLTTRSIVDPDYAAKLTGKRGRNSFGFIIASDNAPGNFSKEDKLNPSLRTLVERYADRNAFIGVARVKRDIGKENSIGMMFTSYNFNDKHNQLLSFDSRFKLDKQTSLQVQVTGTTSKRCFFEPEFDSQANPIQTAQNRHICRSTFNHYRVGNAFGYVVSFNRNARHYYFGFGAVGRTKDFRADVGFTRRTNTNNHYLYGGYNSEPNPKGKLVSWNINTNNSINYDWKGRIQALNNGSRAFFNFQRQTFFGFGFDNYYEKIYEEEFGLKRIATRGGTFFGAPERSTSNKSIFAGGGSTPSKKFSFEMYMNFNFGSHDYDFGGGPKFQRVSAAYIEWCRRNCHLPPNQREPEPGLDPGPANGLFLESYFTFKPIDKLEIKLNYTKSSLRRQDTGLLAFDDNIYSFRSTYQFTRFIFARARIDYDSLASSVRGQFLFGWTPNPGTAFYVGYNDNAYYKGYDDFTGQYVPTYQRNARKFFIKFSYLFRKSF